LQRSLESVGQLLAVLGVEAEVFQAGPRGVENRSRHAEFQQPGPRNLDSLDVFPIRREIGAGERSGSGEEDRAPKSFVDHVLLRLEAVL
jgi:hypothetical protein